MSTNQWISPFVSVISSRYFRFTSYWTGALVSSPSARAFVFYVCKPL